MVEGAKNVWISRESDGWFQVGDEDGEFARANTVEGAMSYVRDLLYGPGTQHSPEFGRLLERLRDAQEPQR